MCCVDSLEGAKAISDGFGQCSGAPPARLLIEAGMRHGRCGVRTVEEGLALARAIQSLPHVELHGVEGYEGLIVSDHASQDAAAVVGLPADRAAALRSLGLGSSVRGS